MMFDFHTFTHPRFWIAIAVLLLCFLLLWAWRRRRNGKKPKIRFHAARFFIPSVFLPGGGRLSMEDEDEQGPAEGGPKAGDRDPGKRKPHKRSGRRGGWLMRARLGVSFKSGTRRLRAHFPGRRYRYRLPWYLCLGASGSGRSTLLGQTGLNLPLGAPDAAETAGPLTWWYFDRGVVLEPDGSLFCEDPTCQTPGRGWKSFCRALYRTRAERALDGVLLTISVKDLMGAAGSDHEALAQRAETIYGQLRRLQKETGMVFPVYVILTGCDAIPGFSAFIAQCTERERRDLFGWSVHHDTTVPYAASWPDQAFDHLAERMARLQLDMGFRGFGDTFDDAFFLLPAALEALREPMRLLLDGIFVSTAYHDPILPRGIYFTGAPDPNPNPESRSQAVAPRSETPGGTKPTASLDGTVRPCFTRDLLTDKIFPERHLAAPSRHKLKTLDRWALTCRLGLAVSTVVLLVGTAIAASRLHAARGQWRFALTQIRAVLAERHRGHFDASWLAQNQNPLFFAMQRIDGHHFRSLFLPASWFSTLDADIDRATTLACEDLLVDGLADRLIHRADLLLESSRPTTRKEESPRRSVTPFEELATYQALDRYVHRLGRLEFHIRAYNRFRGTADLEALRQLVRYCFDFDMSDATLHHLAAMNIDTKRFEAIRFERHAAATDKLGALYDRFLDDLFHPAAMLQRDQADLRRFLEDRNSILEDRQAGLALLRDLSYRLRNTERCYRDEPLGLFTPSRGSGAPPFHEWLAEVAARGFLEPGTGRQLASRYHGRFYAYRDQLEPFLLAEAIEARGTMGAFFNLPFVQAATALDEPVNRRKQFEVWRKTDLDHARRYRQHLDRFRAQSIAGASDGNWSAVLAQLALDTYEDAVNRLLAQAPPLAMGVDQAFSEKELAIQIHGFARAHRALADIRASFAELGLAQSENRLDQYMSQTALDLLFRTDAFLPRDLYLDLDLATWDGQGPISPKGFGLEDRAALARYLEQTRHRLWHLGVNCAAPLLAILDGASADPEVVTLPLVVRWRDMLREIKAYEQRRPYPSIRRLEVFLTRDINRIRQHNYREWVGDVRPSSNYFLDKINQWKLRIRAHCEERESRRPDRSNRWPPTNAARTDPIDI
ncbi:IcmF-related-N domain-containing protein [Sulfidibacter corallicola]|uniref:Type VI secretion system component TssM1 N-terminal domain-containing protein n=1 Tax=Sulfidibacter corallicola TaxID=2818388 RepID=A0A8A4TPF5_SULCO|nr:type VI secretion system protein [Sulfidibacter corallicola]QTD50962.1 hypothetical protein J3U87_00705 [Sulfidibacter corallicola]